MTQDVVVPILDAGLDWLTLTEPRDSEAGRALWDCTQDWLVGSCEGGEGLRDQKPQGFEGAGNAFGFLGQRDGLVMARVSGRNTTDYFGKLMTYGQKFNCTRIDTQVTADYTGNVRNFATGIHVALRNCERVKAREKQAKTTLYQSDTRDTGVTIGARTSETFIRAYHPRTAGHLEYTDRAIRFEIEWKGCRARKVFASAVKSLGVQYLATSLVQGELLARGIREPWFNSQSIPRPTTDYVTTDNEKRLAWFERSVAPALEKMLQNPETKRKLLAKWSNLIEASECRGESAALKAAKGESAYWKAQDEYSWEISP